MPSSWTIPIGWTMPRGRPHALYLHQMEVCLEEDMGMTGLASPMGDGQTEAEQVPSQGRKDAATCCIPPYLDVQIRVWKPRGGMRLYPV